MGSDTPQHDFIILGGGSAGCALAARLSADPQNRVLVLEAGRQDSLWDIFIHMPAALTIPLGNPRYDWCYESEPEPHMGGRRVAHARGKVLGGSSSINGMIFPGWREGIGSASSRSRKALCPAYTHANISIDGVECGNTDVSIVADTLTYVAVVCGGK